MSHVRVQIDFTALVDDDEFVLDQLTEELADNLREIGDVDRITRPVADPQSKGVTEVVVGAVSMLAGVDPAFVQALVDILAGFVDRHEKRAVHLRVGDIELTIDQPTRGETAELIRTVQAAIERAQP